MNNMDRFDGVSCAGTPALDRLVDEACERACHAIAPAWPLDRAIAVNPHWSRIGMPLRRVAARMALLAGIQVFPIRSRQREAWREGRIRIEDLDAAMSIVPVPPTWTPARCLDALDDDLQCAQLPLLIDLLDDDPGRDARLSWRQAITHQVSQTCAAYFDERQADWQPARAGGLYAFWRETLLHDHGIGGLMGLPKLGRALDALPSTRQEAERWVLERLGLPGAVLADYLEAVLLTVQGWASYCAYLGWQARLAGREDTHLRELLAIRLAWGAILLACKGDAATDSVFLALRQAWARAPERLHEAEQALLPDEVWQAALEAGYQRQLASKLMHASAAPGARHEIEVQAAFCIDVRSEPLRRALEAVWPGIQTIGFAGFFGLPLAYTPLATTLSRPQLPGLLAPSIEAGEQMVAGGAEDATMDAAARQARLDHFSLTAQWDSASRWPGAAFSFVEAAGLAYLGKLGRWLRPARQAQPRDHLAGLPARYRPYCRPRIVGLGRDAKVALAAGILRAMGLTTKFAPLVLLVGHGSQTTNNAHAASLDCGACGGQSGEVNARSLARLLNDPIIRDGLGEQGVVIPADTSFMAALHNTTTDEIEAFDLDLLPEPAQQRWRRMEQVLVHACDQVRRERAPSLGLDSRTSHADLLERLRRRANDGAQTRPEWGLTGNASFVIAPRERTRGVVLEGRTFLHDYDASQDDDGSVLESLLTAPMLVTHWINWQYHASTCDPVRLGSGNKLLHNVVGGHVGVFEGNGGDLRIGLPRQSLHDGQRWVHEPMRLTVIVDAPAHAIERVMRRHASVRHLVEHGWIHLWRFDDQQLLRYARGDWHAVAGRAGT